MRKVVSALTLAFLLLLVGAAAGAVIQTSNGCSDDYLCGFGGALVGAVVGETLGVPVGVHLANGSGGSLLSGVGASALVTVSGIGTALLLDALDARDPVALLVLAVPAVQVYRSVHVEKGTDGRD